jgi:hypothetical protein
MKSPTRRTMPHPRQHDPRKLPSQSAAVISALGHNLPPALQKRSQEVGPRARCNPFPCSPDRDMLFMNGLER